MKRNTEITKIITLTLTYEEDQFLKDLVQNPVCNPEDETESNYELRKTFWDTLVDLGIES